MKSLLPIPIEKLLKGAEAQRIEFKSDWNTGPTAHQVLATICAFANDYYNVNGGYFVLGIEDDGGTAVLPPKGIDPRRLETIQKQLLGMCNKIKPVCQPILSHEIVQDRHLLVGWVPASRQRPHSFAESAKDQPRFYVRIGAETKVAKGEVFNQLVQMTAPVPFDDDLAQGYSLSDLHSSSLRQFLRQVGSEGLLEIDDDAEIYRILGLTVPMNAHEVPKNAALLFFHRNPEKVFPGAWIRFAHFRDDAGGDLIEERSFIGPLYQQVEDCLLHLKNTCTSYIRKHPDRPQTSNWKDYPEAAIEETVVNAVHHRDYKLIRDPVLIRLFPDALEVTSYPGPVPGPRPEDFKAGCRVPQTPARNRRIGELLRRLKLAEQLGSGVPKIFKAMKLNGSPEPQFDFDENRFTALLPVRPGHVVEETALQGYREAVFERYRHADIRGIFLRDEEGAGNGLELAEIFVEPRLLLEREWQDREVDKAPDEPKRIGEVLEMERLTLIIGAPGSGKSTLLRCLCLALCRPEGTVGPLDPGVPSAVPILLELKQFAADLAEKANRELEEFLIERYSRELPNIAELLASGRAMVLLDGLDEVFDEAHRRWVSDQVGHLASRFPRARFVLTSRPHGYRAAPLPGSVKRWQMAAFGDQQIRQFFTGWFTALAQEGVEVDGGAERLAAGLFARPRIRAMAENPLLCTLIVLVHRSRSGRLPERRAVFYEAVVRTLVEFWERVKHAPKQEHTFDFPEPELLIRALAEVAWRALHELGRSEIPGDLLRDWLQSRLEQEPGWRGGRSERAVGDILKLVRERTGLLIDLGGDRYQFVHLSLHEYLASHFILDRLDERLSREVLAFYLHAPQWQEVLRLTVSGAGLARAEALIGAILEDPSSEWEGELCRDLRFICRCLGDRAVIGPKLHSQVSLKIVSAISAPTTLDRAGLMTDAAGAGSSAELVSVFAERLADEDVKVRRAAVNFFVTVAADDETTRNTFVERLASQAWRVRLSAVEYLAQVAADDERTRGAVAECLTDQVWRVRVSAVEYFAQVAADDQPTRTAIAERLADRDWRVRVSAVEYFVKTRTEDEPLRSVFAERLADQDWRVRVSAVEYFAQVEVDDGPIRRAVAEHLADQDWRARATAVEYFAKVGADEELTRRAIAEHLADQARGVRVAAVGYFARVADDEPTRIAFADRLANQDWRIRVAAAEYFAQVAADDEPTRRAIAERLADPEWRVRVSAVRYFAKVGADNRPTRSSLVERLGDNNHRVAASAIAYFAKVGIDRHLVEPLLNAFERASSATSIEDDLQFSQSIGEAAAADPDLVRLLVTRGSAIRHFDLGRALAAIAAENDRKRRASKPLRPAVASLQRRAGSGDATGAEELLHAAHSGSPPALGEEHPDTLQSMSNLAATLRELGDGAGALALLEAAVSVGRRVLGEEHPDTLQSMHNLCIAQDSSDGVELDRLLLEKLLQGVRGLPEGTPIRVVAEARWS